MVQRAYCVVVIALLIGGTVRLDAQKAVPAFQAEVATFYKMADGRVVSTTGRVYRSREGRMRQDTGFGAVITDLKAQTVTLLNFDTKEARVFDLKSAPPAPRPQKAVTPRGRTSVEGYEATKVTTVGPQGERQEVWTADQLGAVVFMRTEAPGMTVTRYLRRIAVSDPDASVFVIPPDYSVTKATLPAGFDPLKALDSLPPGRRGLARGVGRR